MPKNEVTSHLSGGEIVTETPGAIVVAPKLIAFLFAPKE
jgi:hypothetical protein